MRIIQTFVNDYKALVAESEKHEDGKFRDKLISRRNIFNAFITLGV